VKALIINHFASNGINIASSSAIIQGNFIGTNSAGTSALGNSPAGIRINGASACTIGGTTTAARNVISGNNGDGILLTNSATNNTVQGNYIGVDATGTSELSNTGNSLGAVNIVSSNNNTIGGSAAGAGNVLSGGDGANAFGIQINQSSNTTVQGNIIGLNAAGTAAGSRDRSSSLPTCGIRCRCGRYDCAFW
jgi:parallel beta-helix repeat protein